MAPMPFGKVDHLQAERASVGIVNQQAGVIQPESAAQGGGDGLEQRLAERGR